MNKRQYNSKLINDKLSEIPVAPNEMLWTKLEAQLLAPQTEAPDTADRNSAAPSTATTGTVKVAITIIASVVAVAVLLFVLIKRPKRSASPKAIPSIQAPSIPPVDSLKADTSIHSITNPNLNSSPGLPKKEVYVNPGNVSADSNKTKVVTPPLVLPTEREHLDISVDSIKTVPPVNPNIQLPVDTAKAQPVRKREDGYYFEVQKKKKKKN